MKTHTYNEIANSWSLWIEYVDPGAIGTEAEFNAMTVAERLAFIETCFGPEKAEETR